jgi:predicted alpha/beta hydrolase family esterase
MREVLFVHSSGPQGAHRGSDDLVRHLRAGLGDGHEVRAPLMPTPEDPSYRAWAAHLDAVAGGATLLVGHSLGASVLVKWLSERPRRAAIAGLFLVATPFWGPSMPDFALPADFAERLPSIARLFLYQSRDDDQVPMSHLERYARALPRATVRALDGYGHLFDRPCPELVADINAS